MCLFFAGIIYHNANIVFTLINLKNSACQNGYKSRNNLCKTQKMANTN